MVVTETAELIRVVCWKQWCHIVLFSMVPLVCSQLTWTPIYVGTYSQVDLWTRTDTGCTCNFNISSNDCACCVPSGGCSCGVASPRRCVQCGLEQHCGNMCNITLDSKQLFAQSNRGFGEIKSPYVEGPATCTYKFVPDTGQRVELQIYRLISVGRHNGGSCQGGWLQLEGGARVCGANERFDRPVVLFSDKPVATLRMQIHENTTRSRFMAYFSFTSKTSMSVGWPIRGGNQVNNTECDWVYEDCYNECVLASPGYPGIYPRDIQCRYLITSVQKVSIVINFTDVLLPEDHCASHNIAIYSGTTTSNAPLKTLCEQQKASLKYNEKNLLIEFRSGSEVYPFNYNGFMATVNFVEDNTEAPTTSTLDAVKSPNNRDLHEHRKGQTTSRSCDLEVNGEAIRSGQHDTRGKLKSTTCRLVLHGRVYDTVHVVIGSYNLSATSCLSMVEIFDGTLDGTGNVRSLKRICSPSQKLSSRDSQTSERLVDLERYSSSGRDLTVVLRRASNTPPDEEFMDVSFYFHDEREGGTQQPASLCDVEYYGLSSPETGVVLNPEPHRLVAIEGPLRCRQHFIPAANQSVIITMESNIKHSSTSCDTQCGDGGCRCVSFKPLSDVDHLLLVSETGYIVTCLCGDFKEWLPVGIQSWTPMYIEWSRSSASRTGISFQAAYKFSPDAYCGDRSTTKLEGEVVGENFAEQHQKVNQFYQQKCTWVLESNEDRQLIIEIESLQSRPCTAWNLTIHEYKKNGDPAGPRLHTFCSRDSHKIFTLPWKMNTAVIRLQALSRTAPQYTMKWRSETTIGGVTHKSGPSPAPTLIAGSASRQFDFTERTNIFLTNLIVYFLGLTYC